MRWNLRMKAAERGIWKSTEMRRRLADAGLEISAGKMSALWTGTPISVRLDDLDGICAVLDCQPAELLIPEPDKVAARKPRKVAAATTDPSAKKARPRLGKNRNAPPV
ncbi:MAG: helix-turn-helix transcriptional regulator [Actinomycetota bacterium]|nr:helix-turn-helix transcriptional regulator [Actinomycetota bacterium]